MLLEKELNARPSLAIIGSGIAGLSAAYFLQHDYDLSLFEANARLGGHTNTIDVDIAGNRLAVETRKQK